MNYGSCLSFQNDLFCLKQDQALDFLDPDQIRDKNDQLSSIKVNQRDVEARHHLFYNLHAMLGFLHHVHQQTFVETLELFEDISTPLLDGR